MMMYVCVCVCVYVCVCVFQVRKEDKPVDMLYNS